MTKPEVRSFKVRRAVWGRGTKTTALGQTQSGGYLIFIFRLLGHAVVGISDDGDERRDLPAPAG